jgi:hypothetical protein
LPPTILGLEDRSQAGDTDLLRELQSPSKAKEIYNRARGQWRGVQKLFKRSNPLLNGPFTAMLGENFPTVEKARIKTHI